MSLDKYQQAWKAEASQLHVAFDTKRLSDELRESQEGFRLTVFWRDVVDVGSSLITIPIWIAIGAVLALPWSWYLMVPAMLWVAGFLLVNRKRHPQAASGSSKPLLISAKESLVQVEHQIWLLRNVFWWYLLPLALSIMAFFLHVAWNTADTWWGFALFAGGSGLFLFVVYGWTYRLNQRAVRDQLKPRREGLQKLIENLEVDFDAEDSSEVVDLVSAFSGTQQCGGLFLSWADNWDNIIPSWREVALIVVPTLFGALCGLWFPIREMGPVFFQSVVAAVIPFEIAFFGIWFLAHRRQKRQPAKSKESPIEAGQGDAGPEKYRYFPNAPALVTIALILVISGFAVAAIISFLGEISSRRGPGLEDISAFTDGDIAHADDWLQRITDLFYPSLSAVVVRDGEVVYQGTFGLEDLESQKPATTKTPYHVASVTKVFTASLAVMLHEEGVVDLDQPVVSYLPDDVRISATPERGAKITLRQLASHTSGLPRGVPGTVQSVEGRYELEPRLLYSHLAATELLSDPGAGEEYSNLGFGLLGHVVELATAKPLDHLLKEMICVPLQFDTTALQDDEKLKPATGYARRSRGSAKTTHSLKERLAGSGGLVTSTEDLAKFLTAQFEPGVFTREMLDELHTETRLSNGSPSGNALGWTLHSTDVGRILEKNGGRSNCNAWIGFSPQHKVAVALVTNCGGPPVDPLGRKLLMQSIPLSWEDPETGTRFAKVAPWTGVRWENDLPIVQVDGDWFELLSIDGITTDRIIAFINKHYTRIARKRFAEDLVEVLSEMGHEPARIVTLELKAENGTSERKQVLMTTENRSQAQE